MDKLVFIVSRFPWWWIFVCKSWFVMINPGCTDYRGMTPSCSAYVILGIQDTLVQAPEGIYHNQFNTRYPCSHSVALQRDVDELVNPMIIGELASIVLIFWSWWYHSAMWYCGFLIASWFCSLPYTSVFFSWLGCHTEVCFILLALPFGAWERHLDICDVWDGL